MNRLEFLEKRKRVCRPKVVGSKKIGTRELLRRMNEKVKFYYPCNGGLRYLGVGDFKGNHIIKIKLAKNVTKRKDIFSFLGTSVVPSVIGVGEGIIGIDNYENPVKRNNIYECMMGPIEYLDKENCSDIKDDSIYIEFIPKSFKKIHVLVNRINIPISFVDIEEIESLMDVDNDNDNNGSDF